MIKIAVISVARSDYSIIKPILKILKNDKFFNLNFYVSGMHLDKRYGHTIKYIKKDNINITQSIKTNSLGDDELSISKSISLGVKKYSEIFHRNKPDLLLVTGDRFEMLAAVIAALPYNIVIAHIHGGELSLGAFDDSIRHAITKFSHIHFPSTDEYARRIMQLGEEKYRVKVVGAPALDNLKGINFKSFCQLNKEYGLSMNSSPIIVTYHTTTRHPYTIKKEMTNLLFVLEKVKFPIIFTAPNADTNNHIIINMIKSFCKKNDNSYYLENLGTINYYSFLSIAKMMLGNSSSGIIEGASFNLPVINVGDRQLGRASGVNVIHCKNSIYSIKKAINKALTKDFLISIKNVKNIYHKNGSSAKIVNYLKKLLRNNKTINKSFMDISI
ncbi:MAG: UDP-N-acetylglucosamine 2-epimerase (hydrolyzing) [Pelagibacterales bacterium]|nr:UDP-N-acetylglucosamine 2-epimerase (hydrolyzing) [Pelagibacterales bacterium]|tara:strand:- start:2470 stop:3627 length:1158 start_codon:yes stop_codon:yes gene_type:complete